MPASTRATGAFRISRTFCAPLSLFALLCAASLSGSEIIPPHLHLARDYGIVPGQTTSATESIQRALDAVQEHARTTGHHCELRFEPGRHLLAPKAGAQGWRLFRLTNASNITINGNGAEFIITNPRYGFLGLSNSENIHIRDFVIDYDPIPFTAGHIRAIHPELRAIDIEIAAPHPLPDAPHFTEQQTYGYPLDPLIPGRLRDGCHNAYFAKHVEPLPNGVFRIHMRPPTGPGELKNLHIGDKWAQLSRQGGGDLFMVSSSKNVTFQSITTYAATAGHYVSSNTSGLSILACKALIKPGRWKGGNADGVHVQNPRSGPHIEDCHFEGLGDDGANIYRKPFKATAISPTGELTLQVLPHGTFLPGDQIEFFDPLTGLITHHATITAVNVSKKQLTLAPSDTSLPPIRTGTGKDTTQIYRKNPDQEFVIKNTKFLNLRRHGTIAKTSGLIEGCTYSGTSSAALAVMNEPGWPEGLYAENLRILKNRFEQSAFEHSRKTPLIIIKANSLGSPVTTPGLHGTLEITGNTFAQWQYAALSLRNTRVARIHDNHFLPEANSGPAIRIAHNTDVVVEQNTFPSTTTLGKQVIDEGGNTTLRILP
ncbi:right-handed parallel beta-helix repeat-containing protein [Geminisphaera colitermitum]|uniref:right-handed parallel beta-helix repeat-containing protein n=1 Tax=Geminisphaera colitermitum TaxID=1148786 RepID=UPI000158D52A|nr:right-handed parallel beta-helix repeat-containing protein [Geminisphaera colitermitum]